MFTVKALLLFADLSSVVGTLKVIFCTGVFLDVVSDASEALRGDVLLAIASGLVGNSSSGLIPSGSWRSEVSVLVSFLIPSPLRGGILGALLLLVATSGLVGNSSSSLIPSGSLRSEISGTFCSELLSVD